MIDDETLAVYSERAEDYARMFHKSRKTDPALLGFMSDLGEGARVLDLGCGPGRAAAIMAQEGFDVTAMDAVPEMVALAATHDGVTAVTGTFDDLDQVNTYHGIWANFSLLHAPRHAFGGHLDAIVAALKPGGVFHIGMKLGTGEARDAIGRLYTYYQEPELETYLTDRNLRIVSRRHGSGEGLDGTRSDWISLRAHA